MSIIKRRPFRHLVYVKQYAPLQTGLAFPEHGTQSARHCGRLLRDVTLKMWRIHKQFLEQSETVRLFHTGITGDSSDFRKSCYFPSISLCSCCKTCLF